MRVINSMSTNFRSKIEEAMYACEQKLFNSVPLISDKAIPKINASQFFRSLTNSLSSILCITQASNVQDYQFKNQ